MSGLWPTGNIDNSNWQSASDGVSGINEAREQMRANLVLIRAMFDAVDANAEVFTDANTGDIAFTNVKNNFTPTQLFTDMIEITGGIRTITLSSNGSISRAIITGGSVTQLLNANNVGAIDSSVIMDADEVVFKNISPNATVVLSNSGAISFIPNSQFGGVNPKLFYNGVEVATLADLP